MNCGTPAATAGQRSRIGKAGVGRAICQLIPSATLLYNLRPALLPQHRGCGGGAINTWVIGVGGVVGYTLPWGLWVHSGVYTPLKATNIVGAAEQDQMKQGAINREPFTRSTSGQSVDQDTEQELKCNQHFILKGISHNSRTWRHFEADTYIYIYIYMHICIYIYIYMYTHICI